MRGREKEEKALEKEREIRGSREREKEETLKN